MTAKLHTGCVSTIIPVYNRARMLREAVRSVVTQSYRPIEVIIVDDGSTDDTPKAIEELVRTHSGGIKTVRISNSGPGLARQAGLDLAEGEFIQFLDSDDVLFPAKFSRQVEALNQNPLCGVCYGQTSYRRLGELKTVEPWRRTGEQIETMFPSMLASRWWGTSTPLYRRSVIDAAGTFEPLRNEEDWEFDCRVAALCTRLAYVPELVSEQRDHELEKLSRGGSTDRGKLKDRGRARSLILEHALRAGVSEDCPEMRIFFKSMFLLARQCGAAGLKEESRQLVNLVYERQPGWKIMLYKAAASIVGWSSLPRMVSFAEDLRHRS